MVVVHLFLQRRDPSSWCLLIVLSKLNFFKVPKVH